MLQNESEVKLRNALIGTIFLQHSTMVEYNVVYGR